MDLIGLREGAGIFHGLLVQFPVVHAKPNPPRLIQRNTVGTIQWLELSTIIPVSSMN